MTELGGVPQPRLHHVQIAIPQGGEERALAFYGDLLGLRQLAKPTTLQARGGVWLASASLEIHCGVDAYFQPARKAHIALEVADLEALRRRLEAAGYVCREDEPLPGYQRFYTDDPFGNRTELLQHQR